MELTDPTTLAHWLQPHSIEWYKQLSDLQGNYSYPWESTFSEPNGESLFDQEVTEMIANKKVLDVGCGHGKFTNQCGLVAKEIIGFDITDKFVQAGLEAKKSNVAFVTGNTKNGLPFDTDEFDCAYIRKGPTSAYPSLKKVVKSGGHIMGLHPGDEAGVELPSLFPNLFEYSIGKPILNGIQQRLDFSQFSSSEIVVINSTEYLHSSLDVLKLRCFGQHPFIFETLLKKDLPQISEIFEENATEDGLPITFSRYIVQVTV
jgi:SAM-dependent methyltransferase